MPSNRRPAELLLNASSCMGHNTLSTVLVIRVTLFTFSGQSVNKASPFCTSGPGPMVPVPFPTVRCPQHASLRPRVAVSCCFGWQNLFLVILGHVAAGSEVKIPSGCLVCGDGDMEAKLRVGGPLILEDSCSRAWLMGLSRAFCSVKPKSSYGFGPDGGVGLSWTCGYSFAVRV